MQIHVRRATSDDIDDLVAFNAAMARETESKELPFETLASGVRSLILDNRKGFYLVADVDGKAVGALMVTFEWSDWRDGQFWWLQSVYVRPAYRRQGVFRSLYQHLENMARDQDDVCGLRLYVEKANDIAQATYNTMGMDETGYVVYGVEFR
jgi:ribosomal protein S18 acetylase RimI-like enzyme